MTDCGSLFQSKMVFGENDSLRSVLLQQGTMSLSLVANPRVGLVFFSMFRDGGGTATWELRILYTKTSLAHLLLSCSVLSSRSFSIWETLAVWEWELLIQRVAWCWHLPSRSLSLARWGSQMTDAYSRQDLTRAICRLVSSASLGCLWDFSWWNQVSGWLWWRPSQCEGSKWGHGTA